MHTGNLVNMVLLSVLGGRKKRSHRSRHYLTRGGSFWSNPSTIMTAAGVAWGLFETLQQGTHGSTARDQAPPAPVAAAPPANAPPAAPPANAPPAVAATAPEKTAAAAPPDPAPAIDEDAVRIVRLAVSAAFADGVVNEHERAAIVQQARDAGVGEVVEAEIEARRPLREIVAGVTAPTQKVTLYVLAFTILRADEQLSGAERIYLAQLAHLLGMDPQEVQALEKDVGERIDALGDQGQLGG